MIIRNKTFYKDSDSCSFNLSFTEADVKHCLIEFYTRSYVQGSYDLFVYQTREDFIGILVNVSEDLKRALGGKYSFPLGQWAFELALRKGYIEKVDDTLYRISENLQNLCELKGTKERGY